MMNKMLFDTLSPGLVLSEELVARLRTIEEHDFGGVKHKVCEDLGRAGRHVTDEWLNAGVLALKQYYAIAIIDGINMHAVSDAVDPFWHAHILHTRQYADFCNRLAGRYLHHEPLDHGKSADVDFVKRLYDFTMRRYAECFVFVDPDFHPASPGRDELVCLHGGDEAAALYAAFPRDPEAQPIGTSFH